LGLHKEELELWNTLTEVRIQFGKRP